MQPKWQKNGDKYFGHLNIVKMLLESLMEQWTGYVICVRKEIKSS